MSTSPVIALSEGLRTDDVLKQVNDVVSQAVKEVADESFSRTEIAELAHDMLKDYKGGVEKMEAVLQHTAVVDEYLGADAKKTIPSVVPGGLVGWLRRTWACIRPILRACQSAAAVSVVVSQKGGEAEEPDAETLSRDTRLVVDEKAAALQVSPEPSDQPTPVPQEENTQASPDDNTAQMEASHQASAEQS